MHLCLYFFALIFLTEFFDQISFVLILLFACFGFISTLFTYKAVLVESTKIKIKSIKTNDKSQTVNK